IHIAMHFWYFQSKENSTTGPSRNNEPQFASAPTLNLASGPSRSRSRREVSISGPRNVRKLKSRRLTVAPEDLPSAGADISKAQRLLRFEPSFSLDEGLHRFLQWVSLSAAASNE